MKTALTLFSMAALLSACAISPGGPRADAQLQPTKNNVVSGSVRFVQVGDKVRVSGEVRGLTPSTEHGFHVHEKGDCSSGDGLSTGGHFNPAGSAHRHHGMGVHHAGDLPSLQADAGGVARFSFESSTIALGTGTTSIVGRGLIVHRDADDYMTQPTGNAGPRLACAVITRS